jgi:sulfatase modifying factor 1|tara:strand:- start:1372 stop:2049 length:678 start_codon:yes stop_codon:yes gene_type:complete
MYFLALGKKQWALMFVLFYIFSPLCLFALPKNNMALVPSGKLLVTNKYESKEVKIENFFIDRFEVTQKLYETIIGINGSFFRGEQRPVEKINWFEAMEYCRRIGKRLPTEFEWEWAARARSKSKFYWGEKDPKVYSWFKKNSEKKTHSVGLKSPNSLGLYDMAGNVWEWTDSYRETTGGKVLRGGSWRNSINAMRSSKWITSLPIHRFHYVGFRCARSIPSVVNN